jgi:hypothetical protein
LDEICWHFCWHFFYKIIPLASVSILAFLDVPACDLQVGYNSPFAAGLDFSCAIGHSTIDAASDSFLNEKDS